MVGDTGSARDELRGALDQLSDFGVYPVAVVRDNTNQLGRLRSAMLATVEGPYRNENAGWKQDPATGVWSPIGDLALGFQETL